MIVAAITKVTTKVAMYSYVNKMVLTAKMAECKLAIAYSALNIILVTRTIGKEPNQTKVTTQSVEP